MAGGLRRLEAIVSSLSKIRARHCFGRSTTSSGVNSDAFPLLVQTIYSIDLRSGKNTRSISGGKETNRDSLSNGERRGKSSSRKSPAALSANCSLEKCLQRVFSVQVAWNGTSRRVRIPCAIGRARHEALSKSRVVWHCSPKRVVNSI